MTTEPEAIGELRYRPNPDYPYPFPVERPPHFWMTEETGALEEAIEAYFTGEPLTAAHLSLIKQYLRQYLERALLTGDASRVRLLQEVDQLKGTREIERFADEIADLGVEPF
jgi:hypothetical protein